jgi:hypothetical protein
MARNLKRTVLYEVIKQKYGKLRMGKKLGRSDSAKSLQIPLLKPKVGEKGPQQQDEAVSAWPVKPQLLGFVPGRRALLISYPVAGLLVLALVLAVLIAFKLGRLYSEKEQQLAGSEVKTGQNNIGALASPPPDIVVEQPAADKDSAPPPAEEEKLLRPVGNHVIVIATYKQPDDLIPVKQYFDKNSIETEIQERGNYYFLVTKDKFQSPKSDRSDGYFALRRIKQVGANYKAPTGYETFAPNLFQDAYGMKIR